VTRKQAQIIPVAVRLADQLAMLRTTFKANFTAHTVTFIFTTKNSETKYLQIAKQT
jgi:hypothetical protein